MVLTKQQESDIKNVVNEVVRQCFADESFTRVFADTISKQVAKTVSKGFEDMKAEFTMFQTQLTKLQGEYEKLSVKHNDLERKIINLESLCKDKRDEIKNEEIFNKVISLEQSNKSPQLRILGFPEASNNNSLTEDMKNFFQNSLSVKVEAIEHCIRLGSKLNGKIRPIIVTFRSMQERNMVFYNKRKLKGQNIVIREELTKFKYDLYKYAREKFGNSTWTKNGVIYIHSDGKKLVADSTGKIDEIIHKTQRPAA